MIRVKFALEYLKNRKCHNTRELNQMLIRMERVRKNSLVESDSCFADMCWLLKEVLTFYRKFIKAFKLLRSEQYYAAWCIFAELEVSYKFIIENSLSDYVYMTELKQYFEAVQRWQSLFPYKLFSSPGYLIEYYTCSICGEKVGIRSRCEHRKGKLYHGQLCLHHMHNPQLIEVSIVTNPMQKQSVLHPENQDYCMVKYVVDRLRTPFSGWRIDKTKKTFHRSAFKKTDLDQLCPCGSEIAFGKCCSDKEYLDVPHTLVGFEDPPPQHLINEMTNF